MTFRTPAILYAISSVLFAGGAVADALNGHFGDAVFYSVIALIGTVSAIISHRTCCLNLAQNSASE